MAPHTKPKSSIKFDGICVENGSLTSTVAGPALQQKEDTHEGWKAGKLPATASLELLKHGPFLDSHLSSGRNSINMMENLKWVLRVSLFMITMKQCVIDFLFRHFSLETTEEDVVFLLSKVPENATLVMYRITLLWTMTWWDFWKSTETQNIFL